MHPARAAALGGGQTPAAQHNSYSYMSDSVPPQTSGDEYRGERERESRDRSPPPPPRGERERERSPYRERDDRDSRRDDRDRSPMQERRRAPPPPPPGRGENAPVSNVLGCFGLSIKTRDIDLEDEFARFGRVEKAVIVYDQRSERSRGFGFVTMSTTEEAERCIEKLNGIDLHGRNIRVAFSMTQRPHASTPGEYMGMKTEPRGGGRSYGGGGGRDRDYGRGGGGGGRYDRDRDYDRRPSYRDDRDRDDRDRGGYSSSRRGDDRDDRDSRGYSRRDDRDRDYDRGYDRPPPPRRSPSPRRD